jgi:Sap-like sulfolipid-1-addressing protein
VSLAEYLLLAIASIFWPLLFAIVLVALSTRHPVRLLTSFLVAGLLTTITIGVVLVFTLADKDTFAHSSSTGRPALYVLAGLLSIAAARYLARRPPAPAKSRGDPRLERYVANTRVAFGAGIVLNILPGFFPLVALVDIAQTSYSPAAKVGLVAVFYVIMFASVEVPILAYGFAPDRTAAAVGGFNAWLNRNGRRLAVWILVVVGVYLIVRGILLLL